MVDVFSDVRVAARTLARSPFFSALAVITLAVGIGATTALFSLVDAVVLRPLPFKEPHRVVEIWGRDNQRTGMRVPGPILTALRERSKTLQAIGTYDPMSAVLRLADGAVGIHGEAVSANFVDVYGVPPIDGRAFTPGDESAGAPAVMLVSFKFWQQYLGGDDSAVGRTLYFDTVPYTVVGVMPPAFRTNFLSFRSEFWTPFAGSRSRARERELGYEIVARVAPGVTVEQCRLEIEAIAGAVVVDEWSERGRRIGVIPLKEEVVGDRAYALILLMTAVGLVLAIACANLAQLLLARSDSRITEFATRKAIGAGAAQLFRLALCESLLLSLAGGAAGLLLAYWLIPLMVSLAPSTIPRLAEATLDSRVGVAALLVSLLTGCAFGSAPAVRLSRLSIIEAMKPRATAKQPARLRSALVVMQVATAVTLIAAAGLVVRTFLTLLPESPGFATKSRVSFLVSFPQTYPDYADRRRRIDDLLDRLRTMPGINVAAFASSIPFEDDEPRRIPIRTAADVAPISESTPTAVVRALSADALELLEIPLVRGRAFDLTDHADGPRVAIVNETFARRLAPSGNVLGQSIRLGPAPASPAHQIVGVVADTRWWGTSVERLNEVYTAMAQHRPQLGYVVVQSPLPNAEVSASIRTAFYAAFPGASLQADQRAVTLDDMIDRSFAGPRFSATLISAFSFVALALAVIGLFGLVAYSVSQRQREFGIRMALGARPADLTATIMRAPILLTIAGIVLGVAASASLIRFVESQLYGITPLTAPTLAAAAAVMLLAAALGAYIPARSVARRDPSVALRYE
jgi:predicted permease